MLCFLGSRIIVNTVGKQLKEFLFVIDFKGRIYEKTNVSNQAISLVIIFKLNRSTTLQLPICIVLVNIIFKLTITKTACVE